MIVNGTLVNYYFHCKRQCYLHGFRLNMEDNSDDVKVGKALHEEKAADAKYAEVAIDHIKLDKLTSKYLVEIKKSDADEEACKWQLLYYLWILKKKGIVRKGKVEFVEKNKKGRRTVEYELTLLEENLLKQYICEIEMLLKQENVPEVIKAAHCKKCAYYEYCFI